MLFFDEIHIADERRDQSRNDSQRQNEHEKNEHRTALPFVIFYL